jgi:hypothetical protein
MRSLHRTWALSLLLCCACGEGTSTGNPNAGDGTGEVANGGGANCKIDSAQEIALDAQTSLGFKASDVLSFVEGEHQEKLTWYPQSGFEYGPESGEHTVTIEIARKGAPRLTKYKRASSGEENIALAFPDGACSDAIEIDVEVHVKSDGGALDETFESTIAARNASEVSVFHSFKDEEPNGSFTVTNVSLPNAHVVQLSLGLALNRYGTRGSFNGIIEQRQNGAVSAGASRDPIASWGPRDCGYHGSPVPRSAQVQGFSGDDVLTLLNRAQSGSVAFDGAQPSSATLAFSAEGDHACAVLDDGYATFGGKGSLYVRAELRIKSSDGRIDATWPVGITAKAGASGELAEAQVAFDDEIQQVMGSGDFAARYGISGLDVSAFDSAIALLDLKASAQQPLSGDLTVNGFKKPNCSTAVMYDANGGAYTNGCPGAPMMQVAKVRISANAAP